MLFIRTRAFSQDQKTNRHFLFMLRFFVDIFDGDVDTSNAFNCDSEMAIIWPL